MVQFAPSLFVAWVEVTQYLEQDSLTYQIIDLSCCMCFSFTHFKIQVLTSGKDFDQNQIFHCKIIIKYYCALVKSDQIKQAVVIRVQEHFDKQLASP